MKTELTCIVCPMSCHLCVEHYAGNWTVTGNTCPRGEKYAIQELTLPKRMLTSTVKVENAIHSRLPVISSEAIDKGKINEVMLEIHKVHVKAPIYMNDIVIEDVAGLGVNIVASRTLYKKDE